VSDGATTLAITGRRVVASSRFRNRCQHTLSQHRIVLTMGRMYLALVLWLNTDVLFEQLLGTHCITRAPCVSSFRRVHLTNSRSHNKWGIGGVVVRANTVQCLDIIDSLAQDDGHSFVVCRQLPQQLFISVCLEPLPFLKPLSARQRQPSAEIALKPSHIRVEIHSFAAVSTHGAVQRTGFRRVLAVAHVQRQCVPVVIMLTSTTRATIARSTIRVVPVLTKQKSSEVGEDEAIDQRIVRFSKPSGGHWRPHFNACPLPTLDSNGDQFVCPMVSTLDCSDA